MWLYLCLRYRENREILKAGMAELGFKQLLTEDIAGYIITSYYFPKDPNFDFKDFYDRLNDKGDLFFCNIVHINCIP